MKKALLCLSTLLALTFSAYAQTTYPIESADYITKTLNGFKVTVPTDWTDKVTVRGVVKPAMRVVVEAEDAQRPIRYVRLILANDPLFSRGAGVELSSTPFLPFFFFSLDDRILANFSPDILAPGANFLWGFAHIRAALFKGGAQKYAGYHYWDAYNTPQVRATHLTSGIVIAISTGAGEVVHVPFPWEHLPPTATSVAQLPTVNYPVSLTEPISTGTSLIDDGFESTLDSNTWTATGDVAITGDIGTITAPQGSKQLLITADGQSTSSVSRTQLATAIGVPMDLLHEFRGRGVCGFWAKKGSAVTATVTVSAGATLTAQYNFLTNENRARKGYHDHAFFAVDPQASGELSKITRLHTNKFQLYTDGPRLRGAAFVRQKGYKTFTYTFTKAGTYNISFGVINVSDNNRSSGLALDSVKLIDVGTSISPGQPE
ncbi:MAG: hypothetical protein MI742_01900 [Desulfobacterales bacterium]|nr:hypothetical protein [Desulfobacterales bacterium]